MELLREAQINSSICTDYSHIYSCVSEYKCFFYAAEAECSIRLVLLIG